MSMMNNAPSAEKMYVMWRMLLPRLGDSVMKLPLQQPCIEDVFGLA
jgi:hypothetical protein